MDRGQDWKPGPVGGGDTHFAPSKHEPLGASLCFWGNRDQTCREMQVDGPQLDQLKVSFIGRDFFLDRLRVMGSSWGGRWGGRLHLS